MSCGGGVCLCWGLIIDTMCYHRKLFGKIEVSRKIRERAADERMTQKGKMEDKGGAADVFVSVGVSSLCFSSWYVCIEKVKCHSAPA